jgi:hypothetical protein
MGYNTMWFIESQEMFQRNMSLPFSGLKNKHEFNHHEADSKAGKSVGTNYYINDEIMLCI